MCTLLYNTSDQYEVLKATHFILKMYFNIPHTCNWFTEFGSIILRFCWVSRSRGTLFTKLNLCHNNFNQSESSIFSCWVESCIICSCNYYKLKRQHYSKEIENKKIKKQQWKWNCLSINKAIRSSYKKEQLAFLKLHSDHLCWETAITVHAPSQLDEQFSRFSHTFKRKCSSIAQDVHATQGARRELEDKTLLFL